MKLERLSLSILFAAILTLLAGCRQMTTKTSTTPNTQTTKTSRILMSEPLVKITIYFL
jgi:type IV pilus biogenesis protein CpaD/CtpE